MQRFLRQLAPFFFFGIAIVAFAFGIMLLAYLFLFGAIVGLVLFIIAKIRDYFAPPKIPARSKHTTGRTIDADDWTKLG